MSAVLVETLLERGTAADMAEAEATIARLAQASADDPAVREVHLLRLRTLLARALGNDQAYADLRNRYRRSAESLGFEVHVELASNLP